MSKEEILVEELIKWFENYGVIIPDGSSATIKDFMVDCEIQSMAEELYEDFFADLQSQLAITEKALELAVKSYYRIDCISRVLGDEQFDMTEKDILKETQNYFIEQAKEMLENE